ncbi:thiopeptide-type bacteriocin biosynthesis protein [Cryptosporangium minutisporangium]|uniref:thiopeptide-type bacteriocin biosynthesis protein n=1 Tax=Cryptosporangium minutisporangium TaxID=113569 RepID=UPI0035EAAA36
MTTRDSDPDWWYVRAYPGRLDLMDAAASLLLPWLRDAAGDKDASAAFFMRYLDMTGQHLRLRLRCSAAGADRLHERIPELTALLDRLPDTGSGPRLVPGSAAYGAPGARRVRSSFYSPELRKYGGSAGVTLAEDLFTASTRWYLEHDVGALDPLGERAGLAVHLLQCAVEAALPGEEGDFWAAHRRQWGFHLRGAVSGNEELRQLSRVAAAAVETSASAVSRLDAEVREHADRIRATADAAVAAGVAVPRARLVLDYLHLDLNRWGFLPPEECLLGSIAAARFPHRQALATVESAR